MVAMMASMGSVMATEGETQEIVYPENFELAQYISHAERVAACQIDTQILKSLSTEDLLAAVLAYPYLMDIYAYNDFNFGYACVKSTFNGLQELELRDNASTVLLQKYKDTTLTNDTFGLANIEVVIGQQVFTEKLSELEKDDLFATAENKYIAKINAGGQSLITSDIFYKSITPYATITTPKGSSVSVNSRGEELEQYEKEQMKQYILDRYQQATILRDATTHGGQQ